MSAEPSGAERFRAEEEGWIASLTGWIGDPVVPGIMAAATDLRILRAEGEARGLEKVSS